MARRVVADQSVFLSTVPVEPHDRRLAFAVVFVSLLLIFLGLAPFAGARLPQSWVFIPIYQSALAVNDLITAAMLLIQFNILCSRALLALAAGYLFTALIVVPHALTFPRSVYADRIAGAGPQTTAWLYLFWHGSFLLAVIAYALLRVDGRHAGLGYAISRSAQCSTPGGSISAFMPAAFTDLPPPSSCSSCCNAKPGGFTRNWPTCRAGMRNRRPNAHRSDRPMRLSVRTGRAADALQSPVIAIRMAVVGTPLSSMVNGRAAKLNFTLLRMPPQPVAPLKPADFTV